MYGSRLARVNEVWGVCVVLEPPGPNSVRVYSVISPLASRGGCQTTAMDDADMFRVETSSGAELGTEEKHSGIHVIVTTAGMLSVRDQKRTIIVRSQVHCGCMVVGSPGCSCRGNGQHIREILPEFGEQEDVVIGAVLDGLVDQWRSLVWKGWRDPGLLQGEQVVGTSVGLQGGVPADDDGCGAEYLSCQIVDRVRRHWKTAGGIVSQKIALAEKNL